MKLFFVCINAENMELFGRLTDASAALGEAKLCSAKGWALWQKVSSEKQAIQQELDAIREKNAQRDRQDKLDCAQRINSKNQLVFDFVPKNQLNQQIWQY